MAKVSRRNFLKLGLGAVGGTAFLLGVYFKTGGELVKGHTEVWDDLPGTFQPNAWLRLSSDGSVIVRINHSEMGQGITTGLAMIIAEELEADWNKLTVEIAPAEAIYKNPAFNTQMTGDSTSVRTSWDILRRAGATAREMLVAAAAMTWAVPTSECRPENGWVIHQPTGQKLNYGQLVSTAAQLPIPEDVTLKNPKDFKIIGQGYPRLDTAVKSTGQAIFGLDVQMPGLLNAVVVRAPGIGAQLKTWDAGQAMSSPGVHHVIEIDTGIAVVADTFWRAQKAANTLQIEWTDENKTLSSDTLREQWVELAASEEGNTEYQTGDIDQAIIGAARVIEAAYELPYQAHATPEPMNCTAYVREGKCDVWAPTQNQDAAQEVTARITGLAYEDINIHTTYLGGGFGRRISVDYVAEAVQISKSVDKPVKVIWTRTDDIQHDFYRPAAYNVLRAGLDVNGKPVAWTHKIVGPDYMAEGLPVLFPAMLPYGVPRGARNLASSVFKAVAPTIIPGAKVAEGATHLPYTIDNVRVNHINANPGIPTGFWRSVAFSKNTFVVESFLDEIAAETGQDSFTLREQLLVNAPRLRNVLRLAAEKANWWQQPPAGVYRGIAAIDFQGTMLSMIAEVSVAKSGAVKVHRIICTLECGVVINPKLVTAQIESGVVFGLTATLKSQIIVKNGRVTQSNFHDFPLLRMDEMPQVEVHIIPSDQPPTGIGEAAVPVVAPAITNAIFAATGKRIRKIPVDAAALSRLDS